MDELIARCEAAENAYWRAWELGRQIQDKPGGPGWEEIEDLMDKAFAWRDIVLALKAQQQQ